MCSRHWSLTSFLFRVLLTFIVMSSTASQAIEQSTSVAQGVEASTLPVKGRAPTAEISVDKTKPKVGDEITVRPTFNDDDEDTVFGTYQWMLGDAEIEGAIKNKYALTLQDINQASELNVKVTPQTDPLSTDPSVGTTVKLKDPINIRWQGVIDDLTWRNFEEPAVANLSEANGLNTLEATVKDLAGNLLSAGEVFFYIDDEDERLTSATVDKGVATAYIRSTVAGEHKVTAKIDSTESSTYVTFVADSATAKIAELSADKDIVSANGTDKTTYTALVKDAKGNILTDASVNWTTTLNSLSAAQSGTDADGKATVQLSGSTAGPAYVSASINNNTVNKAVVFSTDFKSNWIITPDKKGDYKASFNGKFYSHSTFSGIYPTTVVTVKPDATGHSSVTAALTKVDDNTNIKNIVFRGQRFNGCSARPLNDSRPCQIMDGITLILNYFDEDNPDIKPGTYSGTIKLKLNKEFDVNISVSLTVAVDAEVSTLTVPTNGIPADGTSEAVVTFSPKTKSGQVFKGLTNVTFEVEGVGGTTTVNAVETGVGTGLYTATLKGTTVGAVTVKPKIGTDVVEKKASVTFIAGALDLSTSGFDVSSDSIAADGNTISTLTFTPKDKYGNPLTRLTNVGFALQEGSVAGVTLSDVTEVAVTDTQTTAGMYTATLKGTTAGVFTVKPKIGNTVVDISTTVTLTAGPLDLDKSAFIASPTNVTANGTDTSTLTFTPKDKNDNPLTGLTNVTFQVAGLTNTTLSPVTETQTNSGIYTATLTGTILGIAAVKPLVNNVAVGTLSDKVIFTLHRMNSVSVNGVEFAVDKGFPTTGFTGAHFTLIVPGAASGYTWSSSANWATVDSSGNVRFTEPGHSSPVTIRATPNAGGLTLDYTFNVKNWFTNSNTQVMKWSQASNSCSSSQLKQPKRSDLTNMPPERKPGINSLWPEWGSLANYTSSGFRNSDYWSSDISTVSDSDYYVINLRSGSISTRRSNSYELAVCMRGESPLLPSTAQIVSNGFVVNTGAVANGQNSNDLSATVKDANGHAVPNVAVTFAVITGQATLQSQAVRTDVNGVATAKLVSLVAGDNTVTATVGNNTTDPKASTFVAGTLDLSNSGFTVSHASIVADGNTTSTLKFTPKDQYGNPLTGLGTDVTFALQEGSVAGVTLSDVTEVAVTDTQTNSGIYTATLKGTTVGSATVKPQVAGAAVGELSGNVTLVAGLMTSVSVNGAEFAVDKKFPTTGFIGAEFTLKVPGAASDYTWSSSAPSWAPVDSSGKVIFTDKGHLSPVTIRATPKAEGLTLDYTFNVRSWFINNGTNGTNLSEAYLFCAAKKAQLPKRSDLTNMPPERKPGINSLWPEWGRLANYTSSGFALVDYWTSDVNDITGGGYLVSLAHGFSRNGNNETRDYAVCIDALPSGTEVIANNDFNVVSNALANGSHTNALSATVKDANGNRVPNVGVTFAVTKGKATPESQRVQTDANGVATAKLVSLVAGDNLVTATVGGKTSEAKTSTFVAPQITSVSVNGATFDVDKGFPTTGFKGAEFSLVIAETSPLNYTWSSSASWAPVNTTGKVSFTSQGNSSPVIITAQPKAGGTALTYTITVKSWFSHHGSKPQWFWDAMKHCTNRENHVMPAINEMIFSDDPTQRVAGSNKLLSEWGSPGSYSESEFKTNTAYWLSNPFSQGERWTINPDTGALKTTSVSSWSGFAICRQELKPLY